MKVKLNRLFSGLLVLMLLMSVLAGAVSAREILDPNRKCSLTMTLMAQGRHETEKHPVVGAEITVAKVADIHFDGDGNETFYAAPAFAEIDFTQIRTSEDYKNPELMNTILGIAQKGEGVQAVAAQTSSQGRMRVSGMPVGLYVVYMSKQDDLHHTMKPYLVTLPFSNEDGTKNYNVVANPKMDIEWPTIDIQVLKEWKKDKEGDRPKSVIVELLCNGSVYEEVELNKENNWSHTFTDLVADFTWKVQEKEVPAGYKSEVSEMTQGENNTWKVTITNTKKAPPPPLIQTGQLNWPVPVLAIGGVLLILFGWGMTHERKKEQE